MPGVHIWYLKTNANVLYSGFGMMHNNNYICSILIVYYIKSFMNLK
jgi:hypothetical protein